MIQLFDSTLRDGGYINNWNFSPEKINAIYTAANDAGIQYVEIGYLDKITSIPTKKYSEIMVMIDYNKRDKYIIPERKEIDGIRIAVHKGEVTDAITYSKQIKDKGYITALQLMGIDLYTKEELISLRNKIEDIDIVTLADSNGSLVPERVTEIVKLFKFGDRSYKINFHAHNNLQLALSNSITAIDCGVDIIDSTFNGIGRGAGNLPTELIMAYLNKYKKYSFNLSPVLYAIDKYISPLRGGYNWGYNISNMFSGIYGIHPYYGRDTSKYDLVNTSKIVEEIGLKSPEKYIGKKRIVCAIPARYKSSRFEGKPIKLINGIPLIVRVYKNAIDTKIFDRVVVVTDDKRIAEVCDFHKLDYIWQTTNKCRCGTDAIAEISETLNADYYINLQGDESLIMPETIKSFVKEILNFGEIDRIAFNAITECDAEDLNNINVPKIVINDYGDMLYMSRLQIPYKKSSFDAKHYKELGLHGYTKKGLDFFYELDQLENEKSEGLEFLRFLEHGKSVRTINLKLPFKNHAVDVPEDIGIVEMIMKENGLI
ncbi:MAG: 3-deoxy-manno-octulosonate cytidylyltransferase [Actinobacteria bacterium]|nr:3-deoxy-manno-octulosonate cytidylyltransferase [Actinomycetota bacterium]